MSGAQNEGDVSSAHGNGCESCCHRRHPDGGHCYMFKEEPKECYAHKYDRGWVEQNSRASGQKMNKHLESALAKLRECANSTMFVEVNYNEAAALLAKIEAADRLEWQPIETAPKDGSPMLVCSHAGHVGRATYDAEEGCFQDEHTEFIETHWLSAWMPLPPAYRTGQQPAQLLAKHQPCGCIVCTCADDVRCHGCGARHCGTHPVSEIPNAVYEQPAQPGSGEVVPRSRYNAANKDWLDEKAAHEKTRQAAADEINRLQAALTAAQQRIAALEGDSK